MMKHMDRVARPVMVYVNHVRKYAKSQIDSSKWQDVSQWSDDQIAAIVKNSICMSHAIQKMHRVIHPMPKI